MGDTDQMKAVVSQALSELSVPPAGEVTEAAQAVTEAADGAKRRDDRMIVAASGGHYEPTIVDYAWIVPYYVKFHHRDPDGVTSMVSDLDDVRAVLLSDPVSVVPEMTSTVANWEGAARDAFADHVVEPFADALNHQLEVVDELRCALWAYQIVLSRARIDALAIAEATVKVLEGLDNFKSSEAAVQLSVVGAASGLLESVADPGGLQLALRSGRGVEAASVTKTHDIDGYDVPSVLDAMKRALDALEKAMDEEEANIGARIADSNAKVDAILAPGAGTRRTTLVPGVPDADTGSKTDDGPAGSRPRPV